MAAAKKENGKKTHPHSAAETNTTNYFHNEDFDATLFYT